MAGSESLGIVPHLFLLALYSTYTNMTKATQVGTGWVYSFQVRRKTMKTKRRNLSQADGAKCSGF